MPQIKWINRHTILDPQPHRHSQKWKSSVWRSSLTIRKLHRERTLPRRTIIYKKNNGSHPSWSTWKNAKSLIPWHHTKDRASSTCLHRLRSAHRQQIRSFLQEKLSINSQPLLGLNLNISPRQQLKIINLLPSYLIKTNISPPNTPPDSKW